MSDENYERRRQRLLSVVLTESAGAGGRWELLYYLLANGYLPGRLCQEYMVAGATHADGYDWEPPADLNALLTSVAPSLEAPGMGTYVNPKQPDKRLRLSWTKLFRKLQHLLEGEVRITDADIEAWQERLGVLLRAEEYTFELVKGRDVSRTYRAAYFGSCMFESPAVKLYDENPEVVQLLRIRTANGDLAGRALVWRLDDGGTFLDRVYPSDGGAHIDAAMNYAKERGWYYKTQHAVLGAWHGPYVMEVTLKDVNAYPYMDTFAEVARPPSTDDPTFTLCATRDESDLHYTDNRRPWSDPIIGETWDGEFAFTQAHVDEGVVAFCADVDGYVHRQDLVILVEGTPTSRYAEGVVAFATGPNRRAYTRTRAPAALVPAYRNLSIWAMPEATPRADAVFVPEEGRWFQVWDDVNAAYLARQLAQRGWAEGVDVSVTRTEGGWEAVSSPRAPAPAPAPAINTARMAAAFTAYGRTYGRTYAFRTFAPAGPYLTPTGSPHITFEGADDLDAEPSGLTDALIDTEWRNLWNNLRTPRPENENERE